MEYKEKYEALLTEAKALTNALCMGGQVTPDMMKSMTRIAGGAFNHPAIKTWFDALARFVDFVSRTEKEG